MPNTRSKSERGEMKSGWYKEPYDKDSERFWVIGLLPDGNCLVLKTKNDGTNYHDTYPSESDINDCSYKDLIKIDNKPQKEG